MRIDDTYCRNRPSLQPSSLKFNRNFFPNLFRSSQIRFHQDTLLFKDGFLLDGK
jgi:hypothetical protein